MDIGGRCEHGGQRSPSSLSPLAPRPSPLKQAPRPFPETAARRISAYQWLPHYAHYKKTLLHPQFELAKVQGKSIVYILR